MLLKELQNLQKKKIIIHVNSSASLSSEVFGKSCPFIQVNSLENMLSVSRKICESSLKTRHGEVTGSLTSQSKWNVRLL